jgi:CheY-like chemotaxis protein
MRALRERPSERARPTPAIALTTYTRASERVAVMQAGFQAHIPQPEDCAELVATLRNFIARRSDS